ncbi:MAG TPA: ACT domain-containing protein [Burkholderiaceae bacterium]|nr:ACT domain-containing protein [Burkholderiaceae bacterium]
MTAFAGSRTAASVAVMGESLQQLLRTLTPRRNPGVYAFASAPPGQVAGSVLGAFHETEGTTWILEASQAETAGLDIHFRAAWLTLDVNSGLADVGLTAAVAAALADAGIACNVVAALHHDHLFVPIEAVDAALAVLEGLQRSASR